MAILHFDWIFFILADNKDSHETSKELVIRPDPGNENSHIISDEFEFRPDPTSDSEVSCPWAT